MARCSEGSTAVFIDIEYSIRGAISKMNKGVFFKKNRRVLSNGVWLKKYENKASLQQGRPANIEKCKT